jgi:hypothetical protein
MRREDDSQARLLPARSIGKVLRVRSGHTEITLNGLRRKPEVIHANVRAFCPILDPVPDDHTGPCSIAEEIQLL